MGSAGYKQYILLAVLLLLTLCSHVFVFLLLFGTIVLISAIKLALDKKENVRTWKQISIVIFSIILASIIPVLLALNYYLKSSQTSVFIYKTFKELAFELFNNQVLVMYHESELASAMAVGSKLWIMLLFGLVYRGIQLRLKQAWSLSTSEVTVLLIAFFLVLTFLAMYFIMPDSTTSAGYISSRLLLIVSLLVVLLIAALQLPRFIQFAGLCAIGFAAYPNIEAKLEVLHSQSDHVKELQQVVELIESNSVVLPINYSNNWLEGHMSNYLGLGNSTVVLDNYEADVGYFPIKWSAKNRNTLNVQESIFKEDKCFPILKKLGKYKVEYLFVLNGNNFGDTFCYQQDINSLNYHLKPVKLTDYCGLYKVIN